MVKQCLSLLMVLSVLALSSFAQDTTAAPTDLAAPAVATSPAPTPADPAVGQDKPRIYVTDEPQHESNGVVKGNAGATHEEHGPNARVIEIQAHLTKLCPKVTVTNRSDTADFTLLFRREGGKRSTMFAFGGLAGLALSAASKVDGASLFTASGDLVTATKQRTVENAIREICASIPATVAHIAQPAPVQASGAEPTPPPIPDPVAPMQIATVQLSISSSPDGADIEIDGGYVGNTPSAVETTPGDHLVVIHKKGFSKWERKMKVSAGNINVRAELDRAGQ
jgi:hypothetical protein